MNKADELGAKKKSIEVTRKICDDCKKAIEDAGGELTSETTAIFKD
jgi:hypothetical protein